CVHHPWAVAARVAYRLGTLVVLGGGMHSLLVRSVPAAGQEKIIRILPPHEKTIDMRPDSSFAPTPLPAAPIPATVSFPEAEWDQPQVPFSLDEAIRVTLANSQVVRILSG